MKTKVYLLGVFLFFSPFCFGADEATLVSRAPAWAKVIDSEQGQYSVSIEPKQKTVEITRVEDKGKAAPKYLRMRISRKNDRPLEVNLRTIEKPESPLRYTGQLNQWNDSFVGLQLEFSFDKKTWKRLGKKLKNIFP